MTLSIRKTTKDDSRPVPFGPGFSYVTLQRAAFDIALLDITSTDGPDLSVAEVNGQVLGCCFGFDHYAFYTNGRVSWVGEITVKETLHRKGIGKAPITPPPA